MEAYRREIVLACLALYLALCIAVGLWAMRRTRTVGDFFVAGRRLGFLVAGVAIFSSIMSGFAFVGGPAMVYGGGMGSSWIILTGVLGSSLVAVLIGKRLRLIAELKGSLSLPGILAARYDSELARLLTAVAILGGVLVYLAAQILAMARVLGILLGSGEGSFSLPLCAGIAAAVMVFYCTTGGILASVYTDLFQAAVMIGGSILVFLCARSAFEGGFTAVSRTIAADDPEAMSPWGTHGMLACLSWFFVFALGSCGQPHVITKNMMLRRVGDLKRILPLTVIGGAMAVFIWLGVGAVMRALVLEGELAPLASRDETAPFFLLHYAHPALAGVVFAGLFAAIMSTADGFLNIGAAALVHDLPRALLGRAPRRELLLARCATVLIAALAAALALWSGELVWQLGAAAWGIFAAALVPAVAIGLNWKRARAAAANLSILAGFGLSFGAKLAGLRLPFGFDPGAAALVLSSILFLALSLVLRPRPLDPEIEELMEL